MGLPLGQNHQPHQHQKTNDDNAIFFLTLSHPLKYPVQYRDIPEHIRSALKKGEIVVIEKKVICLTCDVVLSEEKTANDHLLSSKHVIMAAGKAALYGTLPQSINPWEAPESHLSPRGAAQSHLRPRGAAQTHLSTYRAAELHLSPQGAGQSPFQSSHIFDKSSLSQEAPSTTVKRTDSTITEALRDGHIKLVTTGGIDGFQCNVCGNANMITGDTPMRQHLIGKKHRKNARMHEVRLQQPSGASASPQPSSPPSRNVDQLPVQRLSLVDQRQSPNHHQRPPHSQQDELNYQQHSHHDEKSNYSQQNEFKYKQNSTQQQDQCQEQRPNKQYHNIVNASPSITINVNMNDFQTPHPPVSTPQTDRGQATNFYKIESLPRGIVVVFNYYFKGQRQGQRDGAAMDYQNVNRVFTKMGYEVWPENIDLTKQETLDKLDEIKLFQGLTKVDPFIAFFLSYGNSTDAFITSEGGVLSVEEIIYTNFTDADCPQLRDKPKLVFFNYSRANPNQQQTNSRIPNSPSAPKDVAVVHATLPHFQALRNDIIGTLFVDCLCKVLTESAATLDLHDIVRKTSSLVQASQGSPAHISNIDFGKFYFL